MEKGSKGLDSTRHTNPNLFYLPTALVLGNYPVATENFLAAPFSRQGCLEVPVGLNGRAITSWLRLFAVSAGTHLVGLHGTYSHAKEAEACSQVLCQGQEEVHPDVRGALMSQPPQLERSMASLIESRAEQPHGRPLPSTADSGKKGAPRGSG